MPKVEKGKLTPKQAKYVDLKASGVPGYKAAAIAYDTSLGVGNAISYENMQKPAIKEAIELSLAKRDLSIDDITGVIRRGIDYKSGDESRDLDVNGKAADRLVRLYQMAQDKQNNSGGNTIIFNDNRKTSKYVDPS